MKMPNNLNKFVYEMEIIASLVECSEHMMSYFPGCWTEWDKATEKTEEWKEEKKRTTKENFISLI